jgi:hypothetical protein
MDMDLERRRLMAALAAVSTGKNLNDFISIPGGIGEKVVLLHALNDAAIISRMSTSIPTDWL